ncbi:hypothetical protein ACLB2K_058257 [Fragaria x ananassa]
MALTANKVKYRGKHGLDLLYKPWSQLSPSFTKNKVNLYLHCFREPISQRISRGSSEEVVDFWLNLNRVFVQLNELMESKGGKKKSSSSKSSLFYEAPLGYSIEDVRPHGGIKKFRSAAYSNCVRKPS